MIFDRFSITELKIDSFAGIHGQKINFDDHCANIVVGENRSGKTSVCEFIRFMLYGLEGRDDEFYPWKASEEEGNWENIIYSNKKIGGTMEIVSIGREYVIKRNCSPVKEEVYFYEKKTGAPVEYTGSIGFALTGLDSWIYDRTLYFSQESLNSFWSESCDEDLNRWAKLFTGRDNLYTDIREAEDKKEKLMNAAKTGDIDVLLENRKKCAVLLDEAQAHQKIKTELGDQLEDIDKRIADNTRRMVILKADMAEYTDDNQIVKNAENAANLKREIQANEKRLKELQFAAMKYKPLNDRSEFAELKREFVSYTRAENEYKEAKSSLALAKTNYEQNKRFFSNITPADIDDEYMAESRERLDRAEGRKSLFRAAAIIFAVIGVIAAVLLFGFAGSVKFSAKLTAVALDAVMVVAFAIVSAVSASTVKKILSDVDAENIDDFDQLYDSYIENQDNNQKYGDALERQQTNLNEKLAVLQSALGRLNKRISPIGIVFNTPLELIGGCNEIILKCSEVFDLEEKIIEQKQSYHNLLKVDVQRDSLEISPEFANLERELSFIVRQNDSLYAKKTELEEQLDNLKKQSFSVEELGTVSDKNESTLLDLLEKHRALQLSCDQLEKHIKSFEDTVLGNISDTLNNTLSFALKPNESFFLGERFTLYYKKDGTVMPFYKAGGGLSRLALIALRIAILSKIGKIKLPMILDESLVFIDNYSVEGICKELMQKERQVIIFSSTKDIISVFAGNDSLRGAKAVKLNSLDS